MPATATPRKPQTLARKLVETRNTSRNRSLAAMLGLGESEKELARDFGSGLNDVIGRGTLASLIGLPGDLGGLAENGIRSALGMPQVQPYGGSEHIGQKLEEAGLVSPVRRPKTELLASLISPSQAASAAYRAPQMARAGVRMLDNLAAPRTMGSQTGAIDIGDLGKMVAPQDEALRVAQQNAAKPIEEGGLGLRPDNTPEERAAAMGFDIPAYHGTNSDFSAFSLDHAGRASGTEQFGSGVYVAQDPQLASGYADARIDGGNVMPLLVRQKSPITPETKKHLTRGQIESILKKAPELDEALWNFGDVGYEGKAKVLRNAVNQFYDAQGETLLDTLHPLAGDMYRGYPQEFNDTISAILKRDGVLAGEEGNRIMSLWNPNQVRSRFAAFDPMRRDSSDILAGLAPLGLGAWMYQDEPVK